jgi:hypothetical protein
MRFRLNFLPVYSSFFQQFVLTTVFYDFNSSIKYKKDNLLIQTEENIVGFFDSNILAKVILNILLQTGERKKQTDILRNQVLVLLLGFTKEKLGTRQIISKFAFKE